MAQKVVTLKDVAAAANVSRATAARALNSYGYVGGETAQRVREAATRLGYQTNLVAQALRSGQLPIIGFVPGTSRTRSSRGSRATSRRSFASSATTS